MSVLRRALRGFYWLGLAAVPFLGAAALAVGAFAALRTLGAGGGLLAPVAGLLGWTGLIRLYRAFVPLPCRRCGRSARASSLNPVTVTCGRCGHVEVLDLRVLGAP